MYLDICGDRQGDVLHALTHLQDFLPSWGGIQPQSGIQLLPRMEKTINEPCKMECLFNPCYFDYSSLLFLDVCQGTQLLTTEETKAQACLHTCPPHKL